MKELQISYYCSWGKAKSLRPRRGLLQAVRLIGQLIRLVNEITYARSGVIYFLWEQRSERVE